MENELNTLSYYTYAYYDVRRGREGDVIYVGKGSTSDRSKLIRMHSHWRNGNHKNPFFNSVLVKIRAEGLEPERKVLAWYGTETEAFEAEMAHIALYKLRRDGGTLCNLSIGGEGPNGAKHTEEMLQAKAEVSKDRWTDIEFKAKTSAAIKAAKSTAEFREKVSDINKQLWVVPGVKEAFSARMKEVLNNPEEKARKAAATKAKWADPEFRAKMAEARAKNAKPAKEKPPKLTKEEAMAKRIAGIKAAAAARTPEMLAQRRAERAEIKAAKKAADIASGVRAPDPAPLTPEEKKAKRSATTKAIFANPETRAKHSAALKAALNTPETKALKAALANNRWDEEKRAAERAKWTPERRAEQAAKMRAALDNPETKARKAEAMRKRLEAARSK